MRPVFSLLCLLLAYVMPVISPAAQPGDPHYTDAGFFDIHFCNWPDQEPFYMALFSTAQYNDLKSVEVFLPEGRSLGKVDLKQYRLLKRKDKPDKRVFISHFDLPPHTNNGWFEATITLQDNTGFTARDYVLHEIMPHAQGMQPAEGAEDIAMPEELHWNSVPGAKYYQIFIRDLWDGDKQILSSKLLTEPRLALPKDLLKPGGLYAWKVHARDVNEHVYLGDFNNGSNSEWIQFSVSED